MTYAYTDYKPTPDIDIDMDMDKARSIVYSVNKSFRFVAKVPKIQKMYP